MSTQPNIPERPSSVLSQLADAESVEDLFQTILGHPIGSDQFKRENDGVESVRHWIHRLLNTEDFKRRFGFLHLSFLQELFDGLRRLPLPAARLGPAEGSLRILSLGTCQLAPLARAAPRLNYTVDHMLVNSFREAGMPPVNTEGADAAIFAPTLRHILQSATRKATPNVDLVFVRLQTAEECDHLLETCTALLAAMLTEFAEPLKHLPVFVASFFEPSFNYLGDLTDPFRPNSPRTFVRKLNEKLFEIVSSIDNLYYLEMNDVLNHVGRMHLQDDVTTHTTHASFIADFGVELERDRVAPSRPSRQTYMVENYGDLFSEALLRKISDNLTIIRNRAPIKLIIVDLDDTLWRGIAAEGGLKPWERTEGWPLGFVEALLYFKNRGGLLAIASKNDREPTLQRMAEIWKEAITPADFASIKIDSSPKSENIAEILRETNILAQNTLFIDDNPREIDEVRARYPEMRFLTGDHFDWRRVVLTAPETQVARITEESARRTELVHARVERIELEQRMSRAEWLRSLEIEQSLFVLDPDDKPRFERGFELINKTNQFNTTGKRWELSEFKDFLASGGVCLLTALKDRTIDNGIIGATLVKDGEIVQAVLSCRVFGLGAEIAMGSSATEIALSQAACATGGVVDTGKNFTCHDWFKTLGFVEKDGRFEASRPCPTPDWIAISSAA